MATNRYIKDLKVRSYAHHVEIALGRIWADKTVKTKFEVAVDSDGRFAIVGRPDLGVVDTPYALWDLINRV